MILGSERSEVDGTIGCLDGGFICVRFIEMAGFGSNEMMHFDAAIAFASR